jgi:hypothetical protein
MKGTWLSCGIRRSDSLVDVCADFDVLIRREKSRNTLWGPFDGF